jgi:hypothetical protein
MSQAQQDEMFSPPSRLQPSQNSFRFSSQASIGQGQQSQTSGGDEFPPLNRNGNGEISQDRVASLMSSVNLGSQGPVASSSTQARGSGNGLLNAVTANTRAAEARSPVGMADSDPFKYRLPRLIKLSQVLGHRKDDPQLLRMTRGRNLHSVKMAPRPKRRCQMDPVNLQMAEIRLVLLATTRQVARVLRRPLKLRPPQLLKILWLVCPKQTNGASREC